MEKADSNKIFLEVGKRYNVEVPSGILHHDPREVSAMYIGHKHSDTPCYQRLTSAEGHLFAYISPKGSLELYTIRTNDSSVPQMWHSEGEDGPDWPRGIPVEKLNLEDIRMSGSEKEYLLNILKRKEESKRLSSK